MRSIPGPRIVEPRIPLDVVGLRWVLGSALARLPRFARPQDDGVGARVRRAPMVAGTLVEPVETSRAQGRVHNWCGRLAVGTLVETNRAQGRVHN